MDAQELSSELIPSPAQIVELIEKLAEGIWPRSDAERKAFFTRLGFTTGARLDEPDEFSATAHYALLTPLPGELSTAWTAHNGHLMGVNMQPYTAMTPDNLTTRSGYDEVRKHLTALFGEPAHPWGDPLVPASVWNTNGRRIVVRFFNLRHSGMMVSVDDARLAAAAESAAKLRREKAHWNNSEEGASPFLLPKLGTHG